MGGLLPKYFKSEWSFAQFRLKSEGRALCAFSDDGSKLISVTTDGNYYLADIPKVGGECKLLEHKDLSKDLKS